MDFHGQNTARGERFLLGFSRMYLILTQMGQLYLILPTALCFTRVNLKLAREIPVPGTSVSSVQYPYQYEEVR